MVHVLVGETEYEQVTRHAAGEGKPVPWIVPKAAKPGDKVILFFAHGKRFLGHGQINSKPESTFFGRKRAYGAEVTNIALFKSPIPLDVIADRFPEWGWVRSYMKSLTTPKGTVAEGLLDFLLSQDSRDDIALPEEVPTGSTYTEGSVQRILVNRYERDLRARGDCIGYYGATCFLCGFDFVAEYGEVMAGFIHVHHLKPLSSIGADYEIDPIQDLRPVCPNCHAVLHRREPPYSLDEVLHFLRHAKEPRRKKR